MANNPHNPHIRFEDTHLVVVSKPAGLLSQGESTGDENLVDWCRTYFGRNYVGLVHRLDRNTSGLMVVAKCSKAADRLTQSLKDGSLQREYQALLVGRLEKPAEWRHWLKKNEATNLTRVVSAGVPGAKDALLRVRPLATRTLAGKEITLAQFELETGRSHQIRAQAAASGFPLLGDAKYGGPSLGGITRTALHSSKLSFPHPMSKEVLSFEDSLPDDLANVWSGARKSD